MKIKAKLWPLEGGQDFLKIWPSDLVFDLIWPILELDQDIIQTNIQVNLSWWLKQKLWPLEGEQGFK